MIAASANDHPQQITSPTYEDTNMREEITATAQMIEDCNAAASLAERQTARLEAALATMAYPDDEDDAAALLQNALCDLRHFADQKGLAFGTADHRAYQIYLLEKRA
ncbi:MULTISPECIES: hypothetical protein [Rhodobacterales]|uniref:Uncharacterized protein n=1 Tax=Pelagivirga sediminicola TaxID=2170575 RepID=A0A2T7G2S3_9RHOB|nr:MULTISPECIES: hypothetical protein [Rhodobacterales]MCQ0090225.1 hypothetical protein [Roseovarius sp. M141]PVA08721.1 hypothetical protein DC366_17800 [Pelagivirga sediminicola]